jgi:hypothetical protein
MAHLSGGNELDVAMLSFACCGLFGSVGGFTEQDFNEVTDTSYDQFIKEDRFPGQVNPRLKISKFFGVDMCTGDVYCISDALHGLDLSKPKYTFKNRYSNRSAYGCP